MNPAFCADDRLDREPSWSAARRPSRTGRDDRPRERPRACEQELQGRSPPGGIEVRVMRKDGTLFDARMYVSPLIDAEGPADRLDDVDDQHHRGQAHPRPAVGLARALHHRARRRSTPRCRCCRCSSGELLFANRSYRLWFGADAKGHCAARAAAMPALPRMPTSRRRRRRPRRPADAGAHRRPARTRARSSSRAGKWLDVRSRYLHWTDGRLAQMLIATDITRAPPRRGSRPRSQAEKAQVDEPADHDGRDGLSRWRTN